jgi:hypothetical protein
MMPTAAARATPSKSERAANFYHQQLKRVPSNLSIIVGFPAKVASARFLVAELSIRSTFAKLVAC